MKPVKLSVIRSDRKRVAAKEVRTEMYKRIRECTSQIGDNLAGFAIVVWDQEGYNFSTLKGGGPIRTRLVPGFAHDALNQHVAVDLAAADRREE